MKNNPFAGLRDRLGSPEPPAAVDAEPRPAGTPDSLPPGAFGPPGVWDPTTMGRVGPARAVIRMERAGRGGKEATVVEQLALPPAELDAWLKALKASLGCGGSVDGNTLMLQGDQRKRLPALLTARGVRKVIVG